MRRICYCFVVLFIFQLAAISAWAAKADCGKQPNVPPKPAKQVAKEDVNVNNDYDTVVKESTQAGIVYLSLVGGSQPKPNACGLNPSNPPAEFTGWGGPLDADNMTIGEGAGTRNDIVIGGVLFERGFGTHAAAKFAYPLTGANFAKFEGYVGMSDEKDAGLECGHGGSGIFTFSVDGKQMFKSALLKGGDAGKNVAPVKVTFDIPTGAKQLLIEFGGGDDGISCDHSCLGDAKLMLAGVVSVSPDGRLSTTWGDIKVSY